MAGITLEQAQTNLDQYLAASKKVLENQSYEIAGRKLTRANLKEIQDGIVFWNEMIKTLSRNASGRSRSRTVVLGG